MPGAIIIPALTIGGAGAGIKAGVKELTPKINMPSINMRGEQTAARAQGRSETRDKLRRRRGSLANILTSPLGAIGSLGRAGASLLGG